MVQRVRQDPITGADQRRNDADSSRKAEIIERARQTHKRGQFLLAAACPGSGYAHRIPLDLTCRPFSRF